MSSLFGFHKICNVRLVASKITSTIVTASVKSLLFSCPYLDSKMTCCIMSRSRKFLRLKTPMFCFVLVGRGSRLILKYARFKLNLFFINSGSPDTVYGAGWMFIQCIFKNFAEILIFMFVNAVAVKNAVFVLTICKN